MAKGASPIHQEVFFTALGRDLRDHAAYDVSFSIGDGLDRQYRDANDEAQFAELSRKAS